ALRDYHRDLRSAGQSDVDLSGLAAEVQDILRRDPGALVAPSIAEGPPDAPAEPPAAAVEAGPTPPESPTATPPEPAVPREAILLTVVFEPGLPWPDMKAKLVLNRLASRGRILATQPPAEKLEETASLPQLDIWLLSDCDIAELNALADVDGVTEIRVESS